MPSVAGNIITASTPAINVRSEESRSAWTSHLSPLAFTQPSGPGRRAFYCCCSHHCPSASQQAEISQSLALVKPFPTAEVPQPLKAQDEDGGSRGIWTSPSAHLAGPPAGFRQDPGHMMELVQYS
ncbi:hypothetical protein H920_10423 [Fukomys damarensis]|uniref:Uncharacterized protein n=1 Tax=Fukomys damarensis TaxID=885580 RepID=A0A091D7Z5_FUKDA|nr:hypothetical protein H920_10423 [Fukomys damarensis]